MISEIVSFALPEGMTREEIVAKYRLAVPGWRDNPDLVLKSFLLDESSRRGGAVYLWNSVEAAKRAHGDAFLERIRTVFGSVPEFQYFDAPIVIDNLANKVVDTAA
jgi:hypothetical protein